METNNFNFEVSTIVNLDCDCPYKILVYNRVKMSKGPIEFKSKTYLRQSIEYSNFEFEVLTIAYLESAFLIVALDEGLNGPHDQ